VDILEYRVTCNRTVWGCLLVAIVAVAVPSCGKQKAGPDPIERLVQVSDLEQGRVLSVSVWEYLRSLGEKEQAMAIDRLVEIAKRPYYGWGRVIAIDCLRSFFNDPKYWPVMSAGAAEVIARQTIELNGAGTLALLLNEELLNDKVSLKEYDEAIWPRCRLNTPIGTIVYGMGLPEGWHGRNGVVMVDGNIVTQHDEYPPTVGPVEFILLRNWIEPTSTEEVTEHTIVAKLTVVSPNGHAVLLQHTTELQVGPARVFAQDP